MRRGAVTAVRSLSLAIDAGSFVALAGPSGSGKTSLLKTINRLIAPSAGAVLVNGIDVATVPPAELRRKIGFVVQQIGLFPHLTIAENIAITPRLLGWSAADQARRVEELLALVELPADFASRKPGALSGGQAQRVGVARALAVRPAIMLMDEPFGALDPLTRASLGDAYKALHERLGLTTLMVTHDLTEALLLADRIVVMIDGEVRADAGAEALMNGHSDPAVAALLAVPRRQAERLAAMAGGR